MESSQPVKEVLSPDIKKTTKRLTDESPEQENFGIKLGEINEPEIMGTAGDYIYEESNAWAPSNTFTVVDNRNNTKHTIAITENALKCTDLAKIKYQGEVIRSYDPAYGNTVCCISQISFIDGDKGILEYRGYPIDQLAERRNFLDTAFLIIYGELPTKDQLEEFTKNVTENVAYPPQLEAFIKAFPKGSHPMSMMVTCMAAMGSFFPESNPSLVGTKIYLEREERNKHILRVLGCAPTIAAACLRQFQGLPINKPRPDLGYIANFLYMKDANEGEEFQPHPKIVRAIEILFILHAEHELNCSTAAVRHETSSQSDVYSSLSGAVAALYGPRHGGATEAVLRMLEKIGDVKNIPAFIDQVKDKKEVLMGFGHRVYKSYDPRAKLVKEIADDVFSVTQHEPLIDIAVALEQIALKDTYFIDRKLYPNVDFYSGVIYKALKIPTEFFTVMFTVPRFSGWLAHWDEMIRDPYTENRIVRPRQIYKGKRNRDYVPIEERTKRCDMLVNPKDFEEEEQQEEPFVFPKSTTSQHSFSTMHSIPYSIRK